jgi:Asp-tRNA(Asn)/Glu-tRNA(Gln) amidotransferase A subunit family amidase
MNVAIPGTRESGIIVPSRLSAISSSAGLLAGMRFAGKDIFHVKGMKTSGGSRSYYEGMGTKELHH